MGYELGILGAGNMAEAIVRGVLSAGRLAADQIIAADTSPERRAFFEKQLGIKAVEDNREVARQSLAIPCSGSHLWRYHELFDAATRKMAGPGAYAVIRDTTCRLFGYHGLIGRAGAFSLDHMFGY